MKKLFALSLSILLALSLFMGCSSPQEEVVSESEQQTSDQETSQDTSAEEPTGAPTSGELHWMVFETPNYTTEFYDEMTETFNAVYPDITLNRELFPTADRAAHVATLYATNQLPDILFGGAEGVARNDGALAPIPDDIIELLREESLDYTSGAPTVYPLVSQVKFGVYYNKELFAELNLTEPKTWDEFIEVCDAIVASGNVPLVAGGPDKAWLASTIPLTIVNTEVAANHGGYYGMYQKLASGEISFSDPEFVEAFSRLSGLVDAGYYHPGSASFTMVQMNETFKSGESAMLVNAIWFAADLDGTPATFDVGFFPLPTLTGDQYISSFYLNSYAVAQNENTELSNVFMKEFISNPDLLGRYLLVDGAAGPQKADFALEYKPTTKMVYDIVSDLELIPGFVWTEDIVEPQGFATEFLVTGQNVFNGADVQSELDELAATYTESIENETATLG